MLFYRILLLLLFFFFCLEGISQQYNFRNYSVGEGLGQSQVYAIEEDAIGNIWFGTRGGGLSKFDGFTFSNFTTEQGLKDDYIKAIITGKDGNLWIGTDKGLSRYDGKGFKSRFSNFTESINALCFDEMGLLWIATENGIFHFNGDSINRFNAMGKERINTLFSDSKGRMWAGTEKGLYNFTLSPSGWDAEVFTKKDGFGANVITSIAEGKNNTLWIATYGGGLCHFQPDKGFTNYTSRDGLTSNTVFSVWYDKLQDELWLGTAYGACKGEFSNGSLSWKRITEAEGIANNVVMALKKDSFGNLWFGTSGGGISRLDSERFIHYKPLKGLLGNFVYATCQDSAGTFWFASSEGGITSYDGRFYKRYAEKDGFTSVKTKTIFLDSRSRLWLGTISKGLFVFDGNKFQQVGSRQGIRSSFINHITADKTGRIWIATAGEGIYYLEPGQQEFKNIRQRNGLSSGRVNHLYADERGEVWAATINGINKISFNEDAFDILNLGYQELNIRSVTGDGNRLYFCTAGSGILIYSNGQFAGIGKKEGLSSSNIYSLLIDKQGSLWAGSEKGLDRISITDKVQISHYGKEEGFTGIEAVQNSAYCDREGNLWFGSIQCLTKYQPAKDLNINPSPKLYISGIQLFFDKIENTQWGQSLTAWFPLPEKLLLPFDKNHLSFEFLGIDQSNPGSVRYSWRLEGFEKDWAPFSGRREAVYSNLPPGEYVFQVKAMGTGASQQPQLASYPFTIAAPFWSTTWFRSAVAAIAALIITLLVFLRHQRNKKQREEERNKLLLGKKLVELEQNALRLQMNPHFLFNCLNSIKGLIAENKTRDASLYLTRFAKLMRAILDNSKKEFISLEAEIAALKNYVDLEKLSISGGFEFELIVEEGLGPESISIPPMVVQPFVENAILHGLIPKGGGKLTVAFASKGHYLQCVIEDDGIGRKASAGLKAQSVHKHHSIAISVTEERLNIISQGIKEEGRLKIIDLHDEAGNSKGTRVEIALPFINEMEEV